MGGVGCGTNGFPVGKRALRCLFFRLAALMKRMRERVVARAKGRPQELKRRQIERLNGTSGTRALPRTTPNGVFFAIVSDALIRHRGT
jgi:hypothetical protein